MPRRILLADDSVTAQNMGKKILSDAGYEVITVSNGSAALKKANELMPDIVVLDVYMPGYSGLEVCKLLKENTQTAELPILLTVGKLEPFKSEEALKARANAFIVKPFEATELLAVIRKMEDANEKAARKPAKVVKPSALKRTFAGSTADSPEAQATELEEKGWKNRLAMPGKQKAETEPEQEAAETGTNFRDLTPAPTEEQGLRRDSAFTANAPAPAEAPLDISPEEIAAIKAAVEVLSGEGDHAPQLDVPAVESAVRHLAPEPEEVAEEVAPAVSAPALAELPAVAAHPHWIAEATELTQADRATLLEREMQESLGTTVATETFNTYSLASFAESDVAEPVDDEPIFSEIAAGVVPEQEMPPVVESHGAALAASASGGSGVVAVSNSPVAGVMPDSAGFQDMRIVAAASAPAMAPEPVVGDAVPQTVSAPDDEIDSRTKSQMDAAWSNWREIRNTIVTPNLTQELAEVATAVAKEDGTQPDSAMGHGADSIARIVDSVLAEMRPKLMEEIARKLAAKKE